MQKKRLFVLSLLTMILAMQPMTVKAEVTQKNKFSKIKNMLGLKEPLYAFHPWAVLFGDRAEDYLLRKLLGVEKMEKATLRQANAFAQNVRCLTKEAAILFCGKNTSTRKHIDTLFAGKEKITLNEWQEFWSNLYFPRQPETTQQKIEREREEKAKADFSKYVYIFDDYTGEITEKLALEKCYKNAPSKHQESILYGINWMFAKINSLSTEEWNDCWDYMISKRSF